MLSVPDAVAVVSSLSTVPDENIQAVPTSQQSTLQTAIGLCWCRGRFITILRLQKVQKYTTLAMSSKIVDTGLKEYSVIYTDRAINLLSDPFKKVMCNISATMKEVYNAHSVALIPGSGSYGMEAVARQYGTGKSVLIIRNG